MDSPLCVSPMTCLDPERAYLLINDRMDWGEPYLLDCRWVRNYEDCGGKDAHAAFVFPWDARAPKTLVVSYKDTTTESIHLQVYDPKQGYVPAGTLNGEGTGRWREAVFPLPAHVRPGREGLIVHFVADGLSHPREPHPIGSMGFLGAAIQGIPLELRPMMEDSKKAWVADYPQATCFSQEEPVLKVDRPCLAMLVLPKGERYLLGESEELPIPVWLHKTLLGRAIHRDQERLEAEVARLQAKVAAAQAVREREVAALQETLRGQEVEALRLQEALRDRGIEVARLEGELAEVRAASELAVEEKDLEIQNLRGELTVQLDARMQLNREFMAFQNSNGIRQVYQLKRWLRRFRR